MEALQLLQVSPAQGPCLTTIEEAGENDSPVHLELCRMTRAKIFPATDRREMPR